MTTPRVLILGLDGVGLELVDQFIEEGALPHLSALRARGASGPLRSTTPPTTLPAWTSFMTGAPPSHHGVPDFTIRRQYSVQFVGARHRRLPTIFRHLEDHGLRVGAAWFPATYPPEQLAGYQISGWDSPVTASGDRSFIHPVELHHELEWQFSGAHLVFDAVDEFDDGAGWYLRAARGLLRSVRRRLRVALWLLENRSVDVAAFYFGEADTAAHHFWAFHDPSSPRRPATFDPELAGVILETYRAIDAAVGALVDAVGPRCAVVLLSDHGSGGASDLAIHLNRMLERAGLLAFDAGARVGVDSGVLRSALPRLVPPTLRRAAFRFAGGLAPAIAESVLRFGGIDWSRTSAFSEELSYAPAIWLNLAGREPGGRVRVSERDEVIRRVVEAAEAVKTPAGEPMIRAIIPRSAVHDGPQAELFPDLLVELHRPSGYTPACLPSRGRPGEAVSRIPGKDLLGRKGRSLPGCHTDHGVLFVVGEGVSPGAPVVGAGLEHVAPVVAALAGVPGAPWFVEAPPSGLPRPRAAENSRGETLEGGPRGYSAEEERVIAERLRRLGYLE